MAKEALKETFKIRQDRRCALCGKKLSELNAYIDTDRKNPKATGGEYTDDNTRLVHPICHMKRHGNYVVRDQLLENLKSAVDDRNQVMKLRNKLNNQLLAYQRNTDDLHEVTENWLQEQIKSIEPVLRDRTKLVEKLVKQYSEVDPLSEAAINVSGIGPITLAYMAVYIDVTKARHASSLWKYCGYDKPAKDRYKAGVAGGGNKTLRTVLYNFADSQIKSRGPYRAIYDDTKNRLENSDRETYTWTGKKKLELKPWKEVKPIHRDGAARRKMIKHFLADYWYVGRTLKGLETSKPYPVAHLGDNHRMIMPEQRGWKYRKI
jgi:hypothetical protein